MNKNLLTLIVMCWTFIANGQCTFERYFSYYPAPENKALILKDGGVLSYGTAWKDTIDFGLKESDLVLIKTDSCGNILWINDDGYLGDGEPKMQAIEIGNGQIIVAGYSSVGLPGSMGNIWLGLYDSDGKFIIEKRIPGAPVSVISGMIRQHKNIIVFGNTYNFPTEKSYPLIVKMDLSLNILNQKIVTYGEITSDSNLSAGVISSVVSLDSNNLACIIGLGSSNSGASYLVRLDTGFNITYTHKFNNDTTYFFGINNISITKNGYLDCSGIYQKWKGSLSREFLSRLDLSGNLQRIFFLPENSPAITSMSPTEDGGYVLGPQLTKIDSNFLIEWIKPTRGVLSNVIQLSNGGYVGGGISDIRTKSWGEGYFEMYLVRTDKDGNYLRSGVSEIGYNPNSLLTIFPNPVNTTLSVQSSSLYSMLELRNITGSVVMTTTNTQTMDVSDVPEGLYILRLLGAQHEIIATQKVSVVH